MSEKGGNIKNRNNSMFRFPFLSDIIEKFKQGKLGKKIIDFFDR